MLAVILFFILALFILPRFCMTSEKADEIMIDFNRQQSMSREADIVQRIEYEKQIDDGRVSQRNVNELRKIWAERAKNK